MPWSGTSFAKHNQGLSGPQSEHAARIANAVLRRSGDEGMSLAVANKYFQHRDEGGGIVDPAGQDLGLKPTTETMNPMQRGMAQRYSSLPVEKLAELAVAMGGSPQGQMIQQILARKRAMPEQPPHEEEQASRAGGGGVERAPPATAHFDQNPGSTSYAGARGYLHGPTAGRADDIMTTAPAGSHVIPADVIGGMGQGNSLSGASVMEKLLATGPGGIQMPRAGVRNTMPRPPTPFAQKARGGSTDQRPVALSHGEFVVPPEVVAAFGGGDQDKGHAFWDWFITEARKTIIQQMKKLPPPVGMKKAMG